MQDVSPDNRRRLIVLGSTGSIGTNTLSVIEHLHEHTEFRFDVVGLAAGRNAAMLADQARLLDVQHVAVAENGDDASLCGIPHRYCGPDAAERLIEAIARRGDLVVGAMVGSAGLPAIVRAIEKGCDIALANKETLVAAGEIVMPLARRHGVDLLPVDSEHSAIFQCLLQPGTGGTESIRRIVLTASGGPFRNATREQLRHVTVEQALNHPTWNMGAKVTIDSATLMNKALEVIEAHHLFGLEAERIDAIIHPQSIVHSFVEYIDGSVIAQLSPPDMRLPIQYALTWPHRAEGCATRVDWTTLRSLDFTPVDHDRFPAIGLAHEVVRAGGSSGAVFNAANEVAVAAFLAGRLPFDRIGAVVQETLEHLPVRPAASIDEVFEIDREARAAAGDLLSGSRVRSG